MAFYLQEARDMGLPILPPTINESGIHFDVREKRILFGLQGIKNVGLASLENIIAERASKPFGDLLDFCKRIDLRTSNKRVIESLICAGAFDSMPGHRAQKFDELGKIIDLAIEFKKTEATGQMGLFIAPVKKDAEPELYAYQPLAVWDEKSKLEKEREVVGFYLSAHPMDGYRRHLKWLNIPSFEESLKSSQAASGMQEPIAIGCGLIKSSRIIMTKKGDRMAFVQLEDKSGKSEIILFPKVFAKVEPWLTTYQVFVVRGTVDVSSALLCKIKANEFLPLELFFEQWQPIQSALFSLPGSFDETVVQKIQEQVPRGKITAQFLFQENGKKIRISTKQGVSLSFDTLTTLDEHAIDVQLIF
jgi:DNA polymerase-3 subunit alpha